MKGKAPRGQLIWVFFFLPEPKTYKGKQTHPSTTAGARGGLGAPCLTPCPAGCALGTQESIYHAYVSVVVQAGRGCRWGVERGCGMPERTQGRGCQAGRAVPRAEPQGLQGAAVRHLVPWVCPGPPCSLPCPAMPSPALPARSPGPRPTAHLTSPANCRGVLFLLRESAKGQKQVLTHQPTPTLEPDLLPAPRTKRHPEGNRVQAQGLGLVSPPWVGD